MTVAAVILSASPEGSLADADGQPRVRRIADSAWSGGALPIIVVAADPEGAVSRALAGAPVTLAEPAPAERGPVGQIHRGVSVAMAEVSGTTAALIWPARMTWVGPETVTSLIEAHGVDATHVLRPSYRAEPGWPVLVPATVADVLVDIAPSVMPDEVIDEVVAAGAALRLIELGDPGVTHDASVSRSALPPYDGPPHPLADHAHEWGAALADRPDDAPLEGPGLAPFDQASAEG